jgi:glycosyltransferase involved in cell wall biosynthesis
MANSTANGVCAVTIVIKTLNEEQRIAECIESALRAVDVLGGEVVLADSCSTDRTVEIASQYPIRIVQLKHPFERCCGVGPQLGYLYAMGDFIYILDGDMEMLPAFLPEALAFLREQKNVGGVGGMVVEMNQHSLEYVARMERASGHMQAGEVDRLDMGGLYRREAIEQAGYFSNRNLHSYEEFDLAMRLRAHGWRLWRLPFESVRHHGHDAPPYRLLVRRWSSRYICGLGELLRNAWNQPYFGLVLTNARELRLYAMVLLWWLTLPATALFTSGIRQLVIAEVLLLAAPVVMMWVKKKSLSKGIFSVVSWNFNTAGLVRGLFATPRQPIALVQARVLLDQRFPRFSELP